MPLPQQPFDRRQWELNPHALNPAPIHREWVLEGEPTARSRLLAGSTDGLADTFLWDCTAGRFNWFYGIDETVYIVEGAVTILDEGGRSFTLTAGDSFFFAAGTRYEWTVASYVRKVAFLHVPLSANVRRIKKIARLLSFGLLGRSGSASGSLSGD